MVEAGHSLRMESNASQGLLERMLRERKLSLWNAIIKLYELDAATQHRVRTYILEDTVGDRALTAVKKRGR